MSRPDPVRVHLVVGGFPPGSTAAHDMDYARLRLLELLHENPRVLTSVASDFADEFRNAGPPTLHPHAMLLEAPTVTIVAVGFHPARLRVPQNGGDNVRRTSEPL